MRYYDRTFLSMALITFVFALATYGTAFLFAGTFVQSVGQSIGQTVGGDIWLFVSGLALRGARPYGAR